MRLPWIASGYSQINNTKNQIPGKWQTVKTEAPESQKDYDEWKEKVKSSKDENEKVEIENRIKLYEYMLQAFVGKVVEFESGGKCTIEVPDFFSKDQSAKKSVQGKWSLSEDNKKIVVEILAETKKEENSTTEGNITTTSTTETRGGKSEYEIVSINTSELIYKVGEGKRAMIFYSNKK